MYDFSTAKNCQYAAPPFSALPPRAASNAYTIYKINTDGTVSNVACQRQPYDRLSLMHYRFPPELTLKGNSSPFNNNFSTIDQQYARLVYPFTTLPPNASCTLKTGNDCNEIGFLVEYGVVPGKLIELKLEYGQTGNKKVSWWKQIAIPKNNNQETLLYILNNSLIVNENKTGATVQIPFTELNKSKGIGFWKAKVLGVHTPLTYKWNVLHPFRGGCRLRLV